MKFFGGFGWLSATFLRYFVFVRNFRIKFKCSSVGIPLFGGIGEENEEEVKGFGGAVSKEEGAKLNVKVSQNEIDKILKEYKRIKKAEKSNLGQVQKLGLVDKNGNPL